MVILKDQSHTYVEEKYLVIVTKLITVFTRFVSATGILLFFG